MSRMAELDMDREREQQEYEEYFHTLTRDALKEAMKYLSAEHVNVLMYHCGFSENDFI